MIKGPSVITVDKKFKVSFVIPVYNVDKYLEETIESLLAQTIGFKENCEIILINDGSTDDSESICLRYKDLYPDNITYIYQNNEGPGEARNKGFDIARGKYVNPIDSDDKLSANAAEEVCKFFDKHYDEIDVVGIKWELFEAKKGGHPLNNKFTKDRIIDLNKEYTHIQSSVAPAFFKREALNSHRFDPRVGRYAEDGRFMGEIMMEREKIGVVVKSTYYYRKRLEQTSSQDKNKTDKFWYLKTPKLAWYDLVDYAMKNNKGIIPKYIQYLIMYDLQWRFNQSTAKQVLNSKESDEYKNILYGLLQYIEDEVIMSVNNLSIDRKIFILNKKHNTNILENSRIVGNKFFFQGTCIYDKDVDKPTVHIEILELKKRKIVIEGYYTGYLSKKDNIKLSIAGNSYTAQQLSKCSIKTFFMDDLIIERKRFQVEIPIIEGVLTANTNGQPAACQLYFHRYSYLSHRTSFSYRVCGKWIISRSIKTLRIERYKIRSHISYEIKYLAIIAKRVGLKPFRDDLKRWVDLKKGNSGILPNNGWAIKPIRSTASNLYTIMIRLLYYVLRLFKKNDIWIISDRIMEADDSGEILFNHIVNNVKTKKTKVYFAISKKSKEYDRLSRIGKVLDYGSIKYKMLFLLSDKIISSEAIDLVINAYGGRLHNLVDLYSFDFIFLQHGIIRDDISSWLNKYNKNIKMFVTSAKPEYQSIIDGEYGYDDSVVKLTGLPRYDKLVNNPENNIIIMPTWRSDLAGKFDQKTGKKLYNPNFKKSEYYQFYQGLMNDKRLISAMKRLGYTGEFYIHPTFESQAKDFDSNEVFEIMKMPHNYPTAKSKAKLMVTDYSSVAFDFAYLRKPVIYAQFDTEKFYSLHTSDAGYFNYETDGFGPVSDTIKGVTDNIIENIQNGCSLQPEYRKRIEGFFAYKDKGSSSRVYKQILKT